MKRILLSALALGFITSFALAQPVTLTDAQMDSVAAGKITKHVTNPGGNEPGGLQDKDAKSPPHEVENQNPAGKAPPGHN